LYQKYFKVYKNIYEFGCGTGHNLTVMAQLLPGKKFFGMDWVPQSQELLGEIAKKYNWPISGINFDFFHPNKKLKLLPDSLIYTSAALEQVGSDYGDFLDYLIANKPALCVNVECMAEYYDEYNLYDYVALRYHKARNYLDGFPTYLRSLEKQKKIKIIADRRTGFGGLYHEGLMYIIWKIL
jgi:trans-aconitate methyltransferase